MFNPVTRCMQVLSLLPLPVLRWLGWLSGHVFFRVSARRRNVVLTNLRLCFEQLSEDRLRQLAKEHFVLLGQSLWDRAWLWHAPPHVLNQRLRFNGDFDVFQDSGPLIVLAPHFVGLDAGGVAMTLLKQIPMACVYVPLSNKYVQDWMMQGRNRSSRVRLVARNEGAQPLLQILREGMRLHYSPDMDFGIQGAVWSDFFGVSAATTNSLPRLVKLSRARICTLVTRLTPAGYSIELGPLWQSYPQGDLQADTDAMNKEIEARVKESPAQYYWVHKRFKTRPPGQPELYRWQ